MPGRWILFPAGRLSVTVDGTMADGAVRHAWLRALGVEEMPARITLADGEYAHRRTFKHDFFAATGLYEGPSGRVILKLGRVAGLFGLPMRWLGRWLTARERAIYQAVDDLPGVPRCLGGWGETGLVHAYVEGHPLQRHERVDEDFFPRLERLVAGIHRRHIAYVDLEKRENILVDSLGRPWLIDFQISWRWPGGGNERREGIQRLIPSQVARFLLARLQEGDRYHLLKHCRRHRPGSLTPGQLAASCQRGPYVEAHRRLSRPLIRLRRKLLKRLTGRSRSPKQEGPEFG